MCACFPVQQAQPRVLAAQQDAVSPICPPNINLRGKESQNDHHGNPESDQGRHALEAALELSYSRSTAFFTWHGGEEMDDVSGDGSAELLDDGSIEISFAYHNGDEATLKAKT